MKKTFKKLLSILMVFAMLFGMVPTQAFAAEDYTWDSGTGTLTVNTDAGITAWETAVSASEIKAVVVKDTVATITGKVFQGLSNLESLTFEGDVTIQNGIVDSVEYYPFSETTKLATITFGGKATLGGGVLRYEESNPNTALKKLSFPAGSTFGGGVFSYCTALEEIVFNGDADVTAGGCFANLTALKKIDFKSESNLSSGAFLGTTNLAEINFGGKTSIGSGMFTYSESAPNTALKSLSFPAGSTFSSGIFHSCNALKELVFEGNVDLTAGGSIYNTPALERVEFKGESKLANGTLSNSVKLKTLIFGGKTDIGPNVFIDAGSQQSSGMDSIVVPAGSTIGVNAFKGANITTIEFKDITPPEFGVDAFAECPQSGIIYVPAEAYDAYVAALNGDGSSTDVANPVPLQIKEKLPTTSVTVVKEWANLPATHEVELPDVSVVLKANGENYMEPVTLNDDNSWTCTWEVPTVDSDGIEIVYTVDEIEVPEGYEKTSIDKISVNLGIGYKIVNTYINEDPTPETPEKITITVIKVWNVPETFDRADLPESVKIKLYKNGVGISDASLYANAEWTGTWPDVWANREDVFTVKEVEVPAGFESSVSEAVETETGIQFTITNTFVEAPETVTVAGTKTWVGDTEADRPESIIVNLIANREVIDETEVTAETQWTYSFGDLPKCDDEGKVIEYSVKEEVVEGYTATYDGYNITNTKDSGEEGGNGGATTPTTPSAPSTPSVPDTSDNTGTLMYLTAMVSSTIALVFVLKKKRDIE